MAWFMDTYSMYRGQTVAEIVTGKPVECGGTAGRREATGRGVAYLVGRVMEHLKIKATEATAIVQGFGNVGSVAALSLAEQGVRLIGVSDHTCAYYDPRGLDVNALVLHAQQHRTLTGFSQELLFDSELLLSQPCDILVPAAMERAITAENARSLRCRILAEGANGPTTPEADAILDLNKDLFVIPDILCNSGGVIVSYFEWVQGLQQLFWDESEVIGRLDRVLESSLQRVLRRAARDEISFRDAALTIGIETVRSAKQKRGLFP